MFKYVHILNQRKIKLQKEFWRIQKIALANLSNINNVQRLKELNLKIELIESLIDEFFEIGRQ